MARLHLGIDTATPFLSLALWSPERGTLASAAPRVERDHGSLWLPTLERVLTEAAVDRKALSAIGAGVGPGSYTGLRVGLAAARGLATALRIPLAGGDTLAAIAHGALGDGETGVATLDARRGMVYAGVYRREAQRLRVLAEPHKADAEELRERWSEARWLAELPPDAALHARDASEGRPARPLYL